MRSLHTRYAVAAVAGAFALLTGCKDTTSVPDLNNVSSATITNGLNSATVQLLVTGLLNNNRAGAGFRYIVFSETMARDVYNLDPAEPRFVTEPLGTTIDPGGFVGAGSWGGYYQSLRTARTILDNLGGAADMSAEAKAGVRGIVRTIEALELYNLWALRGSFGEAVEVPATINDALQPILCQANALAAMSAKLDSAATDLAAAGSSFAVQLPAGFSSNGAFNDPAGFLKFNRAIKARVELYRGLIGNTASFAAAVTAVNASFIDTTSADGLKKGVYYTYSTAPGETTRPIAASTIYLNPAVTDSIQAGDARKAKFTSVTRLTRNGVSSSFQSPLTAPADLTSPLPVIRSAELALIRAQAEIELGQLDAATRDVNVVRRLEGGLSNLPTFTSKTAAINAVLYEKRYSLLLEGAQRLVDLRAYNRLNAQNFKAEITGDVFNSQVPIPKSETDLRGGNVACQ
jgi:hypothetical protein